jgi:hypothetical protein
MVKGETMSKWSKRVTATAALVIAMLGLSVAAVIAAGPLPNVTTDDSDANATALGIPGTLSVSEANAGENTDPNWSAVSIGGTSLIERNADGWGGAGGAVGEQASGLNLCPQLGDPNAPTRLIFCVVLFDTSANDQTFGDFHGESAFGSIANGTVAVTNGTQAYGVVANVLPSGASQYSGSGGEPGCSRQAGAALGHVLVATGSESTESSLLAVSSESPGCGDEAQP